MVQMTAALQHVGVLAIERTADKCLSVDLSAADVCSRCLHCMSVLYAKC